jgi:two-component system cell cycle sensor histidine kinase/response regulator CckA
MTVAPNILIVDNDTRICQSLKYLLAEQGYEADMAYTGGEGINRLTEKPYSVAVVDMVMPGISGPDLMEYIRSYYPDTIVIAMTGYVSTESAIEALKRGAYDYLIKPFEFETLQEVIQNALSAIHSKISSESSSNIYKALVENSPDIIYTLDPEGRFSFVNSMLETLLGFSTDKFIGVPYTCIVHPEDIGRAKWHLNERRTAERSTNGYELRLTTNGSVSTHDHIVVELNAFGMYEKNRNLAAGKKFIGTYGIARDITQKRKIQDKALELKRMASIRTLVGGIAHNFNNALSVISGYTSLFETKIPHNQLAHNDLQAIKDATDRMVNLTHKLLAYSEQVEHKKKPINLHDTVKKVVQKASNTIRPSITLEIDLSPKLRLVEGDPFKIEQVLMNLVTNACEAIEDRGVMRISAKNVLVSHEFRAKHPELVKDKYVLLRVKDTGAGMDEAARKRAFDPFFTTKFTGRGLGLSSALGIIKGHGGHIYINSRKGQGTTVSVCLPLATEATTKLKKIETKDFHGNNETMLIIEDKGITLDVTEKFFSKLGYIVLRATTAQEALKTLKSHPDISLAVMDIDLPDMDGTALYPNLKKIRPDLKVIACSGYPLDGVRKNMLAAGVDDFIPKPFRYNDLAQKIRKVLDKQA